MNIMDKVSRRIVELREEKGETQQELADAIGITRQSLSRYEIAVRTINVDVLGALAQHFGVSSDYILGLSDVRSTDQDMKTACEVTGLSENALNGLIAAAEWGEPALTKTINLLLSELASDLNYEYEIDSGIISQLKMYLYTASNDNRTFSVSHSGKLINLSNTDIFAKPEIETAEDLLSCCRIGANEIIEKVLFERLCDAIKKTKKNLKEIHAENDAFDAYKKNAIEQEGNHNGEMEQEAQE